MSFLFSAELDMVLGCILKDRRLKLKLEQSNVAQALSLQPSTLSKIESGTTKITVEYIAMLCGIYHMSLSAFFDIVEKAVALLRENKILVYTPKTIQYAKINTHREPIRLFGIVPLPFLPFLKDKDNKNYKDKEVIKSKDTEPDPTAIPLRQEQISTMLSPVLNA